MNPLLETPILAYVGAVGESTGGTWGGLILYVAIALIISFLCSVWEAALLSTSLSYVELSAEAGQNAGKLMQKHKANVERPISAILTLNTIAHTVGAAGAGAEAAGIFGNEFITVISIVLTLLILVLSEIIPKTIGAVYWKQLMPFTATSLHYLVLALYPAVWAFEKMTALLRPHEEAPTVTRDELAVMARIGGQEGALEAKENTILNNLFQLQEVSVERIMTPRTVMMALQQDLTIGEVVAEYPTLTYSRIPIYNESNDDIDAYVLRHDIFKRAAADEHDVKLKDISRKIHAIPETVSVAEVIDQFIDEKKKDHLFLVIDEYGGTAGIITLEDALETLLGQEITDESDIHTDMREVAEQRSKRQMPSIDDLDPDNIAPDTP